jgi:hypothetical protein
VEVITTGRYDDELVRTADGWRFARGARSKAMSP